MRAPFGDTRGFALIITLTLLAFLVLLLVGLATLTKVETQISDNTAKQAQARQNALMALNIALGQLQKYAGPDARVTATADYKGEVANPHYTGVWFTTEGASAEPHVWLVSGIEQGGAGVASPDSDSSGFKVLVGRNSTGNNRDVTAPLLAIRNDVLGVGRDIVVGNYAWWVGDQGVKASVGLPDRGEQIDYAPWNTAVQRRRIRQQIAATPSYFRNVSGDRYGFDPFDATMRPDLIDPVQLRYASSFSGAEPMAAFMSAHYHDLTTAAFGVLANTRTDEHRGLMRDLSLSPSELGEAYAAYADYANYMEAPGNASSAYPKIVDVDSPRRRYRMTPPTTKPAAAGLPDCTFGVAPVLSDFLLQFGVSGTSSTGVTVGVRLYVSLWNPYSSALVPDNTLSIDIAGLPQLTVTPTTAGGTPVAWSLQSELPGVIAADNPALGGPVLRAFLPFDAAVTRGSIGDKSSWLPGRVYGWTTKTLAEGAIDEKLSFYSKNIRSAQRWYYSTKTTAQAQSGLRVQAAGTSTMVLQLRNSQGVLATCRLPEYQEIDLTSNASTVWFGYAGRLKQPRVVSTDRSWLSEFDPRSPSLGPGAVIGFDPSGDTDPALLDPSLFNDTAPTTVHPEFLLYRVQGAGLAGVSACNDVPLFELPRLPFLSLGELQHLQLSGRRPFSVGNSWGAAANGLFDRFFFSGIPSSGAEPELASNRPLPNWNLRTVDLDDGSGAPLTLDRLREGGPGLSARFLLQGGSFNLNSTSTTAWRAVLSGVRFGGATPFRRAVITNTAGSASLGTQASADPDCYNEEFNADVTLADAEGPLLASPTFFRFPQSAQESYDWEPAGSGADARQMPTDAFRLGVRAFSRTFDITDNAKRDLTVEQIEGLATQIATLLRERLAASGPFRSLEEFLSGPSPSDAGSRSLLETAIEQAAVNPATLTLANPGFTGPGFSSLSLSQGDLLTALAPYLRTRSDTFLIRVYGDTVNPATGAVEAVARIEATVQRFPSTVDLGDDVLQPAPAGLGRRFKLISFRWLTEKDI